MSCFTKLLEVKIESILEEADIGKGFLSRTSVAQERMLTAEKLGPHEI